MSLSLLQLYGWLALTLPKMPVTEMQWAPRSPRLLTQKLSPRFYYHCSFSAPISVCKWLSSSLFPHCPLIHPTHDDAAASFWGEKKKSRGLKGKTTLSDSGHAKILLFCELQRLYDFYHSIFRHASLHHQMKYVFSCLVTPLLHADSTSRHQSKCLCWVTWLTVPVPKVYVNACGDICNFGLGSNVQKVMTLAHAVKNTKERTCSLISCKVIL